MVISKDSEYVFTWHYKLCGALALDLRISDGHIQTDAPQGRFLDTANKDLPRAENADSSPRHTQ